MILCRKCWIKKTEYGYFPYDFLSIGLGYRHCNSPNHIYKIHLAITFNAWGPCEQTMNYFPSNKG